MAVGLANDQAATPRSGTAAAKPIAWSSVYEHRRRVAKRFGKIFQLPIVRRLRHVLLDVIPAEGEVLEVGAGTRRMEAQVRKGRPGAEYRSMDIDRRNAHDYYDLDDVEREFDCVFSFEVVEHLTLDEIVEWLPRLQECLKPGGALVLSTPNTFYPPDFLRDATHRTALCYDELGGLVEAAGMRVERIARVYHDSVARTILRRYVFGWLFRLIGIDFAKQIVLVARRV